MTTLSEPFLASSERTSGSPRIFIDMSSVISMRLAESRAVLRPWETAVFSAQPGGGSQKGQVRRQQGRYFIAVFVRRIRVVAFSKRAGVGDGDAGLLPDAD